MSKKSSIQVNIIPRYIESQSLPDKKRYVFSYTITITNLGNVSAQLLSRRWLIIDSNGKTQEVSGEGVIGKQPYIKPGESFRYSSGVVIETAVGVMEGAYFMISEIGDNFKVTIPKFTLSIPRTIH